MDLRKSLTIAYLASLEIMFDRGIYRGASRRPDNSPWGPARQPDRQLLDARVRSHPTQSPWLGRSSQSLQFLVLDELQTYCLQESN